jgi:ATP-dependent DNA ligase
MLFIVCFYLRAARCRLLWQIEFTEWTLDCHLRHSKFVGLRDDTEAREVVREIES